MNCKQGDLAIIVKSWAGNEGKIVRCLRFVIGNNGDHRWETDAVLMSSFGDYRTAYLKDFQLRPLRDQDGEDEMLRIAGKPMGITA